MASKKEGIDKFGGCCIMTILIAVGVLTVGTLAVGFGLPVPESFNLWVLAAGLVLVVILSTLGAVMAIFASISLEETERTGGSNAG